jgi:hypothetical protein|tara:strand:+ start:105 stop:323 length:219 start_codon:yes stop_codon:yes gene_type:complete
MKKRKNIMKLSNGKKIIERTEQDYKKNINIWTLRGWKPVDENVKENVKEVDQTFENETVVPIKPKKRKEKKK